MDAQFWFDSWEEGGFKTSFHRRDIHPYIIRYFPPEKLQNMRVLVPLCGKTLDLEYFRQNASYVTGVELVKKAICQFFEEQELEYECNGNRFEAKGITIINDDFLTLTRQDIGQIDLIYDRASLVALPISMRLDYIEKINELLPIGGQQFVNTLEYSPFMGEPPFSVTPDEVKKYYGQTHHIQHLEEPMIPKHGLIRKWGLDYVKEHGFLLTKFCD